MDEHWIELLPVVMSVSALYPVWYNHGFKNPSGGRPFASSLSLISATIAPTVGLEALVPVRTANPPSETTKLSALAARSGNARPLALNRPAFPFSLPCADIHAETAASW